MAFLDVLLIAPLAMLIVYLRVQRTYRRRKVRLGVMTTIAVLGVFPTLRVIVPVVLDRAHLPGVAAGIFFGVALGLFGLFGARFERDHTGLWHKPDPYAGSVFLVVVLSWLLYRVFHVGLWSQNGFFSFPFSAPWGLFVPAMVVGYWYTNFAGILRQTSRNGS